MSLIDYRCKFVVLSDWFTGALQRVQRNVVERWRNALLAIFSLVLTRYHHQNLLTLGLLEEFFLYIFSHVGLYK